MSTALAGKAPTATTPPTNGAPVLTEGRKAELLQSARRSRLQWVLSGRDSHPIVPFHEKSVSTNAEEEKLYAEQQEKRASMEQLISQIPAAPCVQEVLEFFNQLINDGDSVDLESILMTIQDDDDVEGLVEHFKQLSQTDIPSSSSSSVTSYDLFIKKLLHPQAALVVKAMQQFITKFTTTIRRNAKFATSSSGSTMTNGSATAGSTTNNIQAFEEECKRHSQSIFNFLEHIYEIMKECPLFAEESPSQFEESKNCCEKFVFTKLHPFLFTANDYNDRILNQATAQRIESLSFITVDHLDIKSLQNYLLDQQKKRTQQALEGVSSSSFLKGKTQVSAASDPIEQLLSKPIAYLQHFAHVTSPPDALLLLRYCSQAIAQVLKDCRTDGKLPGADELLPVLILVIKYSNPPHLHSWIKYLQRYTRPSKLVSEAGYLITNFVSAVYFLDHVDAKALTISPEEFEQSMKVSKAKAKERLQRQQQQQPPQAPSSERDSSTDNSEEIANLNLEQAIADYQQQLKRQSQKEYVSIKATMALLQYGKP